MSSCCRGFLLASSLLSHLLLNLLLSPPRPCASCLQDDPWTGQQQRPWSFAHLPAGSSPNSQRAFKNHKSEPHSPAHSAPVASDGGLQTRGLWPPVPPTLAPTLFPPPLHSSSLRGSFCLLKTSSSILSGNSTPLPTSFTPSILFPCLFLHSTHHHLHSPLAVRFFNHLPFRNKNSDESVSLVHGH